jgi:DNA-binding PadR family transcriptional regulator
MVSKGKTSRPDQLAPELRRGSLVLAILACLRKSHYGYALRQALAEAGLEIAEGTLYPLLRRLESQGLLTSEWFVEDNRPRRYYRTSAEGRRALTAMSADWRELVKVLERLLAGE